MRLKNQGIEILYDINGRSKKIAENYHVRLSIKTKEDLVDQRQIFLFNDGSFHTVLKEGAQYIRSSLNEEDNRIDVFFEGKDDFFKNRNKEKDIVLYSLLREINVFLLHFRLFSIEWARNYMEIINRLQKRCHGCHEFGECY